MSQCRITGRSTKEQPDTVVYVPFSRRRKRHKNSVSFVPLSEEGRSRNENGFVSSAGLVFLVVNAGDIAFTEDLALGFTARSPLR